MTLREKLAEVNPDLVGERFTKGVSGCPYNYDFLHVDDLLCEVTEYHPASILDVCRECWNREYVPAETVDHPEHYRIGKYECIDEMLAMFGVEQVKAFCRCNVYKYRYRATQKGGEEDLQKAEWYMDFLMKLEGRENRNVTLL